MQMKLLLILVFALTVFAREANKVLEQQVLDHSPQSPAARASLISSIIKELAQERLEVSSVDFSPIFRGTKKNNRLKKRKAGQKNTFHEPAVFAGKTTRRRKPSDTRRRKKTPTKRPTKRQTPRPTKRQTPRPTKRQTKRPTKRQTKRPTRTQTERPSTAPKTRPPIRIPTFEPEPPEPTDYVEPTDYPEPTDYVEPTEDPYDYETTEEPYYEETTEEPYDYNPDYSESKADMNDEDFLAALVAELL
jgi:hypothetical protein